MELCLPSSDSLSRNTKEGAVLQNSEAIASITSCTKEKTLIFDDLLSFLILKAEMFISISQQEGDNVRSFLWVMQSTVDHLVSWEHTSRMVQKLEHVLNSPHYV